MMDAVNILPAYGPSATSRDAHNKISKPLKRTMMDRIEEVVASARSRGLRDMSGKEIQDEYNRLHGHFVEMSTLSGRIHSMIESGRLERDELHTRPCRITGQHIAPVKLPVMQVGIPGAY
jgi:hypothetical protein